jgi:NADPH:quinone reductase-like Zn-dependent oxidoreductase
VALVHPAATAYVGLMRHAGGVGLGAVGQRAGANVWFDTSGRIDFELAVEIMAERGSIVLVAAAPAPPPFPVTRFFQKSLRVAGFVITTASPEDLAGAAKSIDALLAAKRLAVRVERVLSLDRAAEAHRLVEERVRGRVVLALR